MYRVRTAEKKQGQPRAQLLGSGAILNEAIKAQQILAEQYQVAADVWSVTSYQELYRDGHAAERWNRLHPDDKPRVPYVTQCLGGTEGVIVAASDYVKALPDAIDRWLPRPLTSLGTDGFGLADTRAAARRYFLVDAESIVVATLQSLARDGAYDANAAQEAFDRAAEADPLDPLDKADHVAAAAAAVAVEQIRACIHQKAGLAIFVQRA
jgi:pyruvate dehydrogenase E1 component